MSVCNLRPESRGSVHAISAQFGEPPAIRPELSQHRRATGWSRRDAIRLTRRIVQTAPMQPHAPEEFMPGPSFQSDEELAKAAGQIGTTIFHPVGTAKMGSDDTGGGRRRGCACTASRACA